MTPLDEKLEALAREAAQSVVFSPAMAKPRDHREAVILTAMRRAIREAVLASGAVEALEDAAALAQLVEPSDEEDLDTVSKLERAHALYDAALANLRALTQP